MGFSGLRLSTDFGSLSIDLTLAGLTDNGLTDKGLITEAGFIFSAACTVFVFCLITSAADLFNSYKTIFEIDTRCLASFGE